MAGTDNQKKSANLSGPAIVLVAPQMGENIGACARAMLNFGLGNLRLVRPRDGWPNAKAVASSSGASAVLDAARLYDTTADAVADLGFVLATTARPRDMAKDVWVPRAAVKRFREMETAEQAAGVLFGPERAGLENDDVALADAVLEIPANPAFSSLNIAQAVLVLAYEWFHAGAPVGLDLARPRAAPADRQELVEFFEHLEKELDAGGFLKPAEKRPRMVRNLRNLFHRARLTGQEVRTLRGVITALTRPRRV